QHRADRAAGRRRRWHAHREAGNYRGIAPSRDRAPALGLTVRANSKAAAAPTAAAFASARVPLPARQLIPLAARGLDRVMRDAAELIPVDDRLVGRIGGGGVVHIGGADRHRDAEQERDDATHTLFSRSKSEYQINRDYGNLTPLSSFK